MWLDKFLIFTVLIFTTATKDLSDLNIMQYIEAFGYPVQIHEVITEDGYVISVHRIPHGAKTRENTTNPKPVLLHHGLLCSAENWLWVGPNKSLAFLLADDGYDVWMMNDRGTMHSRKHLRMKANYDKDYWQFSFHEIGVFDIPNTIDYILNATNRGSLHYVGHSQGVTTMLVMGSERPEHNEKINVMIGLAPAATFKHMTHAFINRLLGYQKQIFHILELMSVYEFPPFIMRSMILDTMKDSCKYDISPGSLCKMLLDFGGEEDMRLIDKDNLPFIISTLLSGASAKQFQHFGQMISSGKFRQFDWGKEENLRRYNASAPPRYNLKNVTYPTALFFAQNDLVVSSKDTTHLARKLPNVVELYEVPVKNFNHLDFLWSKELYPLVNKRVLEVMNKYDNKIDQGR